MLASILYQFSVWALPVVLAITLHEAAHAYVASLLGDPTARSLGRVTLNPLRHVDPFGTVVLPLICVISPFALIFGYAKPVPVDFSRLGNPRRDMILVAAAGPLANVALLLVSALLLYVTLVLPDFLGDWLKENLKHSLLLNAIIAVFNMLPVPPLDGGRIVTGLLPYRLAVPYARLERFGIFIVLGLLLLAPAVAQYMGFDVGPIHNILLVPVFGLMDFALWAVGI